MTGPGLISTACARSIPTRSRKRRSCDRVEPSPDRPLAGIPILIKDNIATGDRHAHDGRVAGAWPKRARPRDATLVARLRAAGAVILGKANLTEFANILAIDMPSGYSSLGGQVRNPYAPGASTSAACRWCRRAGRVRGRRWRSRPGCAPRRSAPRPRGRCCRRRRRTALVTVKPTVGLISRAGILPIAHSQDTAGPLTRTVRDAAILLNVLAAPDPRDPATLAQQRPADYTAFLDPDGLRGARIGVPSDPSDPGNDVYFGKLGLAASAVMAQAIAALEAGGATIVRANIPTEGWIGGPGTEMAILNRNPESPGRYEPARRPIVFVYELKHDLERLSARLAARRAAGGHADSHSGRHHRASTARMPTGRCASVRTSFSPRRRRAAICRSSNTAPPAPPICAPAEPSGSTPIWTGTGSTRCCFPAPPGPRLPPRPAIRACRCRPGSSAGIGTPACPFGATFTGRAWSEPILLRLAYAFEQATQARRAPPGLPALQ